MCPRDAACIWLRSTPCERAEAPSDRASGPPASFLDPDQWLVLRPRANMKPVSQHEVENAMKIVTMVLTACTLAAPLSAQVPDFTPQTPLIGALLHNDTA